MATELMPKIDYFAHPAFDRLGIVETSTSARTLEILDEVDEQLGQLVGKAATSGRKKSGNVYLSKTAANFTELHAALLAERSDWTVWELERLKKTCARVQLESDRRIRTWVKREGEQSFNTASELADRGYSTYSISEEHKSALVNALEVPIRRLTNLDTGGMSASTNPATSLEKSALPRFRRALRRVVDELDLETIASNHLRFPARVTRVSLHVNRPQDRWWINRYADIGLAAGPTANLHYDSNTGMLKAMIYLNEVSPDSGPFSYIPGSSEWHRSPTRMMVGQALPYEGISLNSAEQRRFFLKLPPEVRQISHFGDDVAHGSEAERQLLAKEQEFTSDRSDVILFDPYGLHRGGLAIGSPRIALQVQLSTWSEWARGVGLSGMKWIASQLKR